MGALFVWALVGLLWSAVAQAQFRCVFRGAPRPGLALFLCGAGQGGAVSPVLPGVFFLTPTGTGRPTVSMYADAVGNFIVEPPGTIQITGASSLQALQLGRVLNAGGCSSAAFHCIGTGTGGAGPSMNAAGDLYINGNLDVASVSSRSTITATGTLSAGLLNLHGCSGAYNCMGVNGAPSALITGPNDLFVADDFGASNIVFRGSLTFNSLKLSVNGLTSVPVVNVLPYWWMKPVSSLGVMLYFGAFSTANCAISEGGAWFARNHFYTSQSSFRNVTEPVLARVLQLEPVVPRDRDASLQMTELKNAEALFPEATARLGDNHTGFDKAYFGVLALQAFQEQEQLLEQSRAAFEEQERELQEQQQQIQAQQAHLNALQEQLAGLLRALPV